MLVHRLPLGDAILGCGDDEASPHLPGAAPRIALRAASCVLLGADLAALALSAISTARPMPYLVALLFAAAWLAGAWLTKLYQVSYALDISALLGAAGLCCGVCVLPCLILASGLTIDGLRHALPAAMAVTGFIIFTRFVWWTVCKSLVADGFCLARMMVLGSHASEARVLAAEIDRRSHGFFRPAACAAIPATLDHAWSLGIEDAIRAEKIDYVVVVVPREQSDALWPILGLLAALRCDVAVVDEAGTVRRQCSRRFHLPEMARPMPPLTGAEVALKRCADLAIASAALVLTAPILFALCLLIKLDSPGPVLFRQRRVGKDELGFDILKFRTMYHEPGSTGVAIQTCRNDRRVTRIGAHLRRTSLDELPQLINVLRGNMSIVGPRPHATGMTVAGEALDSLVSNYTTRHRMKPGITGWAQVNGCRGELINGRALRRRVALDCHYIDNWSLAMDIRIILRTAGLMIRDPQAY